MDIDFVVLWVDGSDPVWQAEKAKYQGKTLDDNVEFLAHCFCVWLIHLQQFLLFGNEQKIGRAHV